MIVVIVALAVIVAIVAIVVPSHRNPSSIRSSQVLETAFNNWNNGSDSNHSFIVDIQFMVIMTQLQ